MSTDATILDLFRLDGRVAVITGASSGLGVEFARALAEAGADVSLGARRVERLEDTCEQVRARGRKALAVGTDVAEPEDCQRLIDATMAEFGRVDILVNNAGIALDKSPASETERETLRRTYDTNVFGVFAVTQALLPLLKKSAAGRIVNMSSGLGSLTQNSDPAWEFAGAKPLAYNSSKAALNMITVLLAAEFKDTALKINAADPGFTATDLNQHRGTRTVEQGATIAIRLALLPQEGPTGGYFDENGPVPW